MSSSPKEGAPRWRRVTGVVSLIVVGVFLALAVVRNWSAVRDDLDQLSWVDWGLAFVWGSVSVVTGWGLWSVVLTGMGGHLGGHDSRAVFYAGQLGKYVPGSVWPALIQSRLAARHDIRPRTMFASYFYAIAVTIATGGIVGVVALVGGSSSVLWISLGLATVSVVGLVALLSPRGVFAVLERLGRRWGKDFTVEQPTSSHKLIAVVLSFATWLVLGLHVWAIARPLGATVADLPVVIGGFALAGIAGVLVVPVPGGAGVREALLVLTIGTVVGRPSALTIALISRLVLLAVDVVFALGAGAVPLIRSVRRSQEGTSDTAATATPADLPD